MKKYILTDDYEIYKVTEETTYRYQCRLNKREIVSIPKQCVIKEECMIDELCDSFVCVSNEERNNFVNQYNSFRAMINDDFYKKYRKYYGFYGSIWIKGDSSEPILKPIAKINEKGELELL